VIIFIIFFCNSKHKNETVATIDGSWNIVDLVTKEDKERDKDKEN